MTVASVAQNLPPVSTGEEDMRQFIHEIRQFPRLTVEEERDLARRCAEGDQEAIRQMVNANLRLVVSVAREYAGRGVPLLDLIQEGSIGLIAAAKKFDYTLEYRFSTYATKWIRQGVLRYLTEQGNLIRVPAYTADRLRKLRYAEAEIRLATGREPTVAELAEKCGLPQEKLLELQRLQPELFSLDAPAGEKDAVGQLLEDLHSPQPQENLVRQELDQTMERLLGMLDPRQRQILRMHFGMEDGVCHSLDEIGQTLGISKERVRQVEKQAMDKLKTLGADVGLEDFLE